MSSAGSAASPFAKLVVLLVEDEPFSMKLTEGVLKRLGVRTVITARDGAEALRILESSADRFNLIISDWSMPQMSGLELLKEVRRTWENMPFLMLTGNATTDFVLQARDSGVDAYIVKPFSPDQLNRKLRSLFNVT